MAEKKDYKVVGTRPIRHDGVDKVTGRALYGADFQTVGLLHGKVLRSPHAHARIKSIDTSRAEAHPGVRAVVTAKDFPAVEDKIADLGEGAANVKDLQDNVLAGEKALYKGHQVAAVAAIDPHTAEEALELIDVEYEVLPPVIKVLDAMKEDAPLLHEDMHTDEMGEKSDKPSNIAAHFQHKQGDPEKGYAEADVVVEQEYTTETVHQGYIEPHNATALYNPDGQLTIWCSTQGAFAVRGQVSEILQIPVSKVKVVPMEIGGGFGGKINVYIKPIAAMLSMKTGKPVKVLMSRADVFEGTGPTPGSYVRVKMGATRDGRITGAEAYLAFEAGAYPGSPVGAAAFCVFRPIRLRMDRSMDMMWSLISRRPPHIARPVQQMLHSPPKPSLTRYVRRSGWIHSNSVSSIVRQRGISVLMVLRLRSLVSSKRLKLQRIMHTTLRRLKGRM